MQAERDDIAALLVAVSGEVGTPTTSPSSSRTAIEELVQKFHDDHPWLVRYGRTSEEEFVTRLGESFHEIDRTIERSSERDGHAATLTATWIFGSKLYVAHVGDDEVFRLRENQFEKLTTDHTVASELVEKGVLDPDDERADALGDVLWNTLGSPEHRAEPAIARFSLEPGDRFVVATRGLSESVGESMIEAALRGDGSPEGMRDALEAARGIEMDEATSSAFAVIGIEPLAGERVPLHATQSDEAEQEVDPLEAKNEARRVPAKRSRQRGTAAIAEPVV